MKKNAGANSPAARPFERREFGFALASLGVAAILGLPDDTAVLPPSDDALAWMAVLASLGRELDTAEPVPAGATVCTPSGWVLSGSEADACRRIHERLG